MIRSLTEGEAALAREMFGAALRLDSIRMVAAPWPVFRAFVAGRWFGRDWVVWPSAEAAAEFAAATVRAQALRSRIEARRARPEAPDAGAAVSPAA